MKRVIGLGHALVDLLYKMPDDSMLAELNLPKGSMQLIDEQQADAIEKLLQNKRVEKVSGGSAANTIHGLARLGVDCGYIGTVHPDSLGDFYKNNLREAGISAILFNGKSKTGRAYTFVSPDSERTFATYLGASSEIELCDITPDTFKAYDIFHIEGYQVYNTPLISHCIRIAKETGLTVSIDMASYNVVEDNLSFLKKALPAYVDMVFANEEEARAYTGLEPAEALKVLAKDCETAIVKVGKDGSLIHAENKTWKAGIIACQPVDTTGAGDAYAAGFIYGIIQGLSPEKCGQIGALLAGKVIEKYGARIPESDWKSIIGEIDRIKQ